MPILQGILRVKSNRDRCHRRISSKCRPMWSSPVHMHSCTADANGSVWSVRTFRIVEDDTLKRDEQSVERPVLSFLLLEIFDATRVFDNSCSATRRRLRASSSCRLNFTQRDSEASVISFWGINLLSLQILIVSSLTREKSIWLSNSSRSVSLKGVDFSRRLIAHSSRREVKEERTTFENFIQR